MVYVDINGRCGNQLFQYAFARKLMIVNKIYNLHFDFFHVDRWKKKLGGDITFSDQLIFFKTINYSSNISSGNGIFEYGSKRQKKLAKRYSFIRKISRHLNGFRLLDKYQ